MSHFKALLRLTFFWVFIINIASAQPSSIYKTNWQDAGLRITKPIIVNKLSILDFGGDNTGLVANDLALSNAISALGTKSGTIFFPNGKYLFNNTINIIRDSILLKGNGYDSSILIFNFSGATKNCIDVIGSKKTSDTSSLINAAKRDSNSITVLNASKYNIGDWVEIGMNDSSYFFSSWAYGSFVQVLNIANIIGNKITFTSPLRSNYPIILKPFITKLIPKQVIGIECLKILRLDATSNQTSIINLDKTVNCWIDGIESDSSNFAHVAISQSSNIEVTNSYFHHAFAYGGSGQGYGIAIQYGSGECKIESNIFRNLRHSVLFQSAANGNVVAYNYSKEPYWTGTILPANSAGDIVLHGNLPYSNLIEGNINQNTVIDDSHGTNGSFNTFFRNRSEGYGILMNTAPATDSVQIIGHEITNPLTGLYSLAGKGRIEFANNVNGTFYPTGTSVLSSNSLYIGAGNKPKCPDAYPVFPCISFPNTFNTGINAAKERYSRGRMAICACETISSNIKPSEERPNEIEFYPNPFQNNVYIKGIENEKFDIKVYTIMGQCIWSQNKMTQNSITTTSWPVGLYIIHVTNKEYQQTFKLLKQ